MRNPKKELTRVLEEITDLLERYGEVFWRDWIARDARLIREGNSDGVEHLLSAFGGMGSFTDLFLSPVNGHKISQAEIEPVNERLRALSSQAYEIARQLQRAA